ncbi:sensor histidine kinase [Subtercola sp. Z020]|nr:sensor histidine kinase [Subtercola sp. Z020]
MTLTVDASGVDATLAQLRWIMLAASAAFLVLAAAALALVVRRTLAPLESMTGLARDIAGGDRGRRLRPDRPQTEIGQVAAALDEMLDEIEGAERVAREAESRVRAFVSDAAHELRTPVAGMQAAADTLVRSSVDRNERERLATHVVREAGRASRLIDDMLLMARVDRGLELDLQLIDLGDVVAREVERQRIRRPLLDLSAEAAPAGAPGAAPAAETSPAAAGAASPVATAPRSALLVRGDAERLGQVVANLVDNAARMTGGAGPVRVSLARSADSVTLRVADGGPGVPIGDRSRIFDRLVRLDSARNATGGGAGLGLPIARGIARAHGGELVCVDPTPGESPGTALGEVPGTAPGEALGTAPDVVPGTAPGATFMLTLPPA